MTAIASPDQAVLPGGILIRALTEADLPTLEWGGEFRHFRHMFRQTWEEAQTGRRRLLGAFDGERIVGQIFIQWTSADSRYADGHDRAYLYSLRVRREYRGRGIGTRLILEAEAQMRERGFTVSVIAAAKDNRGAESLYRRLGYRPFMEEPGRWTYFDLDGNTRHVEEPCWVMEKRL